jgi:hypothetical protein
MGLQVWLITSKQTEPDLNIKEKGFDQLLSLAIYLCNSQHRFHGEQWCCLNMIENKEAIFLQENVIKLVVLLVYKV